MQYFTSQWHSGDVADADADDYAFEKYENHIAPLLPQWPPDVQTLAQRISLHDGLILELTWDVNAATLRLSLRCGDLQVGYFDLDLCYCGVLFSPFDLECLAKLDADKNSEALYGEVDEEAGRFVHGVLFISPRRLNSEFLYHEIAIRFERLCLTSTSCESRFGTDGTDSTSRCAEGDT